MLAWLLLSVVPFDPVIREQCHRLETNNLYDENGNYRFTQLIAWHEYSADGVHVFFWAYREGTEGQTKIGSLQRVGNKYVFRFDDGVILREIWSLSHCETWDQFDPEIADQDQLPVRNRRPLRQGSHERHHPPLAPRVPIRSDQQAP